MVGDGVRDSWSQSSCFLALAAAAASPRMLAMLNPEGTLFVVDDDSEEEDPSSHPTSTSKSSSVSFLIISSSWQGLFDMFVLCDVQNKSESGT